MAFQFEHPYKIDVLKKLDTAIRLGAIMFEGDNESNVLKLQFFRDYIPFDMTGHSVVGLVIRADGGTVYLNEGFTVEDNRVSIPLPQSCFAVPGQITISVRAIKDGVKTIVFHGTGTVIRSSTDTIIDPGQVIPSVDDVIAKLDEMDAKIAETDEAIEDAEEATANANNAVEYIATTETSPAAAAHAVGKYLIYNGALYEVTAAIAVGDTLTAGTNIAAVPKGVAGEVTELKSAINSIFESTVPAIWEIGTINANTGLPQTSTTRIRTKDAITTVKGVLTYSFDSGYKANVYTYTGNSFDKTGFVTTGGSITLDGHTSFKVVFAKSDDSTLSNTDIAEHLTLSFASSITESIDTLYTVTEQGKNLLDESELFKNLTVSNGYYSATASTLSSRAKFPISLEANETYTLSCIAYTDADADVSNPTKGNGIQFKFDGSGGTVYAKPVANDHTSPFNVVYTFTPTEDVVAIYFGYGSVGGNTWHIKDLQIEEGNKQTDFTPFYKLSAIDIIARNALDNMTSEFASNATVPYSSGGMSLKAFKELHYTDGTQMSFTTCLWIDTENVFYMSDNARSTKQKVFKWDVSLTEYDPEMYSAAILKDGSVLFVFRTQFFNETSEPSDSYRKNPIIYTRNSGKYVGQVIDFGNSLKPTNWLQNVGFCELYEENCIIFAEYTRGNELTARVWRITYPVTDPTNWDVVLYHEIPTPWQSGFKHFHTVQQDPYTGIIYVTSGDNDVGTGIWYSTDGGLTFTQLDEYDDKKYRMLNMVFRNDYIYWATDDWAPNHVIWRVARDNNGLIDPETLTVLLTFPNESASQYIATYATVYIPSYNALLILNRIDTNNSSLSTTSIPVLVYDFNDSTLYIAGTISRAKTEHSQIGFRTETITFTTRDNKVVCSFSTNYPNHNKMLGNADGETRATQVNTIEMTLHKLSNGYSINYDVIL